MSLVLRNPSYDIVRWIDEKGLERVRVNRKNAIPYLVPDNELQDKHKRYYFTQTMQLSNGDIFISPLI